MVGPVKEVSPSARGFLQRLLGALGFAAGFMLQWEAWVLWLAPLALGAVTLLLHSPGVGLGAVVHVPFLGPMSPWFLIGTGAAGLLRGAEIVILVSLVAGRRGLDLHFLWKNRPAALLAAGLIVGARFAAAFSEYYVAMRWKGVMPGGWGPESAWHFLVMDFPQLAIVFSAWIAFGRIEADAGRRSPGLGSLARAGCVILVAGLIGPIKLLDLIVEHLSTHRADPGTAISLNYAVSAAWNLIIVFALAWFLRYLVTGREERPAAAA